MNIIRMAFRLLARVSRYADRARQFFYQAVLLGRGCPRCGGSLKMIHEGRCRCRKCGYVFDPTVAFQACSSCGGRLRLRVRRYECRQCGSVTASRFLFEGLVIDGNYFRKKMVEHRKRRKEQRERVRKMLAESRSMPIDSPAIDLGAVPGLLDALNSLTAGQGPLQHVPETHRFDLARYERHVQAHLRHFPLAFDRIPPLDEDSRLDRIWRFIAIVFLAHAGLIRMRQKGQTIMIENETDREGQGVSGEAEAVA